MPDQEPPQPYTDEELTEKRAIARACPHDDYIGDTFVGTPCADCEDDQRWIATIDQLRAENASLTQTMNELLDRKNENIAYYKEENAKLREARDHQQDAFSHAELKWMAEIGAAYEERDRYKQIATALLEKHCTAYAPCAKRIGNEDAFLVRYVCKDQMHIDTRAALNS